MKINESLININQAKTNRKRFYFLSCIRSSEVWQKVGV